MSRLSPGYPPLRGWYPRVPQPCATQRSKLPACDLHALGTSPAFILSQDQTLRLISIDCCRAFQRKPNKQDAMLCTLLNWKGAMWATKNECYGGSSRRWRWSRLSSGALPSPRISLVYETIFCFVPRHTRVYHILCIDARNRHKTLTLVLASLSAGRTIPRAFPMNCLVVLSEARPSISVTCRQYTTPFPFCLAQLC